MIHSLHLLSSKKVNTNYISSMSYKLHHFQNLHLNKKHIGLTIVSATCVFTGLSIFRMRDLMQTSTLEMEEG